ncbi:MAG: Crp/Fnr family transcriptional regulator [Gammaproteobacteria bacterium]|nr:Crp/Fnr family transcriptional regulator [Gammaproteobacteria bacterium]
MTAALIRRLASSFPALGEPGSPLFSFLAEHGRVISVLAGAPLFHAGATCDEFILTLEGTIRVQKVSADGHEIVLFRVDSGHSCILTNSCLLGGHDYPAAGVAETDCQLLLLAATHFQHALAQFDNFRQFVFAGISDGVNNIVDLLEAVAFGPLNQRLAHLLLLRANGGRLVIKTTHQALAMDLGTAREVVSRLLKEFEHHGLVRLSRGKVQILNPEKLQNISHGLDQ